MRHKQNRGFTLIELIVVIAIVAVLVTIVILAINPAEQLARSRDSKRVSDLDTLRSAWNLYLAQATGTPDLSGDTTANNRCRNAVGTATLFINTSSALSTTTNSNLAAQATSSAQGICSADSCATTDSWAPGSIGQTPGGSPVSNLPLDPTSKGAGATPPSFYYAYACDEDDKTYEFTSRLESTFFTVDNDIDGTDGGNSTSTYEIGSKLTIIGSAF